MEHYGEQGAAFNNRHVAGSGIVIGAGVGYPNALHVNALWANGIPFNPPILPAGTIFAMPGVVPPAWALPTTGILWIA